MVVRRGLAAASAALILSACGGSGPADQPARPFDSVKQMVAALKAGGVRCMSLHAETDLIASDAAQCLVGEDTIILDIYASRKDRDRAIRVAKGLLTSGSVVVGPNWTVGTRSGDVAGRVQAALGGERQTL